MPHHAEEYYPSWLRDGLIDNSYPWEDGIEVDWSIFVEQYVLPDSLWLGIWTTCLQGTLGVIRLETAWNESIPYEEEDESVPFWPILLIHFGGSTRIAVRGDRAGDGFGGMDITGVVVTPSPGGTSGFPLLTTKIVGTHGFHVTIRHQRRVHVLCRRPNGDILPTPMRS
jgi:hypothetical protein